MDTEIELRARLDEAGDLGRGSTQSDELEAVVARAQAQGFDSLALAGLVRLTSSYHNGGEPSRYTRTVDDFRAVAAVATAQGYGLINAGYAFDEAILRRLGETGGLDVTPLDAAELSAGMQPVASTDELLGRRLLRAAVSALVGRDCEVLLRRFDPFTMPALYLRDGKADRRAVVASAEDEADALWSGVIRSLPAERLPASQFVLNYANPLIRRLIGLDEPELCRDIVAGLFVQALLQGRHPMQPGDTALLNSSCLSLIDHVLAANGSEDRT